MNIELGKTYRTRHGDKVRVICVDLKTTSACSVVALVTSNGVEHVHYYTPDGMANLDLLCLVSEWTDPVPWDWSTTPPWLNWLVQSDDAWFLCERCPCLATAGWSNIGRSCYIPAEYAPRWTGDWRNSLTERPR